MKFPTLFAVAALVATSLAVPAARAETSQYGTVYRLHVRAADGLIYFYLDGPRAPQPGCATQPYWIIANEASAAGKQQLALLLLAQATGRSVAVWGAGTCTRWPDGEDVRELALAG